MPQVQIQLRGPKRPIRSNLAHSTFLEKPFKAGLTIFILTCISLSLYLDALLLPCWLFRRSFFSSAWHFSRLSPLLRCSIWYFFKAAWGTKPQRPFWKKVKVLTNLLCMHNKNNSYVSDPSHPALTLFQTLPTRVRYWLQTTIIKTSRHRRSFFPWAVALLNNVLDKHHLHKSVHCGNYNIFYFILVFTLSLYQSNSALFCLVFVKGETMKSNSF